jgi:hypothetical protein
MADLPCGASGLLVGDYKGKEPDRLVYGVDTASSLNCALPRRFGPLYDNPTRDNCRLLSVWRPPPGYRAAPSDHPLHNRL